MSLSGISLLDALRDHLAGDADLTALATGGLFHGRVDNEAPCPFALYRIPRIDYETGFGPQSAAGQTAEAVVNLVGVDESTGDTALLTTIAARLDDLMRTWQPAGWRVVNLQLDGERLDAFDGEGRTYQSASMTYNLALERT